MALPLQSSLANASMRGLARPNASNHVNDVEKCVTDITYNYYGSPETVFWIMGSILVIALNGYCINSSNNSTCRRTLYSVLFNSLMASNMFCGVVIHPMFAYLSQSNRQDCVLLTYFAACCVFNLISTLLSITLITINRFMILQSSRIVQQNSLHHKLTKNKSYCIYFSILSVSLIITLVRMYMKEFGTTMLNVLIAALAIIITGLLWNLHSKLKHILIAREEGSLPANTEIQKFKASLYVLKLAILSMVLLCLPLIVTVTIIRSFSLQSSNTAISITAKLIWFRPAVDPISYLVTAVKKRPVRTRVAVIPLQLINNR